MFPAISRHKLVLGILDVFVICSGFYLAFWYVFASGWHQIAQPYPLYFMPSLALVSIIVMAVFQLEGLYKYQSITNPIHQLQSMMKCYLRVIAAFIALVFFLKTEYIAGSRLTIGLGFLASFLLMVPVRSVLVPRIFFCFVKRRLILKRALIIGAGEHGDFVCAHLESNPHSYFEIVGFCDDDMEKVGTVVCGKDVLGTSYELETIIARHRIREIIISISRIDRKTLLDLIDRCKAAGSAIHVISDLVSKVNDRLEAEEFGGLRTYRIAPRGNGFIRSMGKWMLDLVGSSVLLFCAAPLFLIIGAAIKRDSEGPVFYRSKVVGKAGRVFMAYKFRSMISGDTEDPSERQRYLEGKKRHLEFMKDFIQGNGNGECYLRNESRITRVGRVLRKYSLDELPQLINVFRGEMSLVGPRFCSPEEYRFYKSWHRRRFQVKPGMTGLWQVCARSEVNYDDMVMLDLYYVENWSILFDFEILLRTIPVAFRGRGSRIEK